MHFCPGHVSELLEAAGLDGPAFRLHYSANLQRQRARVEQTTGYRFLFSFSLKSSTSEISGICSFRILAQETLSFCSIAAA